MSKLDRGSRFKQRLPSCTEIAEEVHRVGVMNDVKPTKVIVFGSYATGDYTKESDVKNLGDKPRGFLFPQIVST